MRVRLGEALALIACGCVLASVGFSQIAGAQAPARGRAPTAAETGETSKVQQINNWTLGLAGGLPEGTFIRFAAEIARNVNDPAEILAYGLVDLPDRASLDRELARVARQESMRHDRLADVIESTTVRGIFELTHSFDFSTDEAVARGRP